MLIIAIDQAITTGWAVLSDTGCVLDSGSICFRGSKDSAGESRGMMFLRFSKWLSRLIGDRLMQHREVAADATHTGVLVIHERPLIYRSGAATEIAAGLKAIIEQVVADAASDTFVNVCGGINVTSVNPAILKHWATGDGRAGKEKMVQAVRISCPNINPKDDNEADAILIGKWAAENFGSMPHTTFEEIRNRLTPPPPPRQKRRRKPMAS